MNLKKLIPFLFLMLLAFTGCKKGEDDPLISFRSRKARVAGDWKMTGGSSTYHLNNTSSDPSLNSNHVRTRQYRQTAYTETYESNNIDGPYSHTKPGDYSLAASFKKDGTYEWQMTVDGNTFTIKGTWNFSGKVGDVKNKEQIVLTLNSYSGSFTPANPMYNQNFITYRLKELRNKKMVLTSEIEISEFTPYDHFFNHQVQKYKEEFILEQ